MNWLIALLGGLFGQKVWGGLGKHHTSASKKEKLQQEPLPPIPVGPGWEEASSHAYDGIVGIGWTNEESRKRNPKGWRLRG